MDGKELWGVVVMNQDKLTKMDVGDLLGLLVYQNRTVLVDFAGQDKPSSLTVVHEGNKFYFRTVKDKTVKNNFNNIPAIKLISANKLRLWK